MVRAENCINVYSEMNPWIDIVITIEPDEDYARAYEVVGKAYEEWFEDTHESDEPISKWIGEKLTESEIKYEMYFKSEVEEDD